MKRIVTAAAVLLATLLVITVMPGSSVLDLNIDVGSAADYAHVTASVTSGGIDAAPFGESRGGLFRSFEKFGGGKYKLAAHVGAGQLTLR